MENFFKLCYNISEVIFMTGLLVKLFIKNPEKTTDENVRTQYGLLAGIVGIVLNIVLVIMKLIIGSVTNSISIVADALNNLSDAASSTVSTVGFKIASRPADDEHPFGHGRIEYISSIIVSFLILLTGFELFKTSIDKIIYPQNIEFSIIAVITLSVAILFKLWLAIFNKKLGKKINSLTMKAVVVDSLSDSIVTFITLIVLILSKFTNLPLDGISGLIVSVLILVAGIKTIKETIDPLLGKTPSPELVKDLEKEILSYEGVVGIHDLIIHDYGPNRVFGSVHAEVPADTDIMKSHDTIDIIEKNVSKKFKMHIVIHMDPIVVDDERVNSLRNITKNIVYDIDPALSIHDFRIVEGPTHTNFIFDLVVPHKYPIRHNELAKLVSNKLSNINDTYFAVISVENSFV